MGTATEKVIDQIIENRRKFEDFCFSLSDEELDRPVPESTWLVRDFAAHLATLDPGMAQLFEATVRNERMTTPDGGTFDGGSSDGGTAVDAGTPDAGTRDGGAVDGGSADSGVP